MPDTKKHRVPAEILAGAAGGAGGHDHEKTEEEADKVDETPSASESQEVPVVRHRHHREGAPEINPKLGFVGSILYGGSRVLDSGWGGAARFVGAFKGLDPSRAMIAVLAVALILGATGSMAAVAVIGYMAVNRGDDEKNSQVLALLLKSINEKDDKMMAEREKDRLERERDRMAHAASEEQTRSQMKDLKNSNIKLTEKMDQLTHAIEKFTNKLPDPQAPTPRTKGPFESDGAKD